MCHLSFEGWYCEHAGAPKGQNHAGIGSSRLWVLAVGDTNLYSAPKAAKSATAPFCTGFRLVCVRYGGKVVSLLQAGTGFRYEPPDASAQHQSLLLLRPCCFYPPAVPGGEGPGLRMSATPEYGVCK